MQDIVLAAITTPEAWWARTLLMAGGVLFNAVATAMYLGSQFGAGPRDGLMTGLHRRTGASIRVVRTGLEVVVVAIGWMLGGVAGVGTVVYALAIGPLAQLILPYFVVELGPVASGSGVFAILSTALATLSRATRFCASRSSALGSCLPQLTSRHATTRPTHRIGAAYRSRA